MIGWMIAVLIAILIALVLFSRLRFYAEAEKGDTFKLICKFWFFKLFELPEKDDDVKIKTVTGKKPAAKSRPLESLNIKVKTYDDVLQLLHTVKNILSDFKALIKHIVIKNTESRLIVVGKDAADTALKYGAVCSAAYPIITLMAECFTFKPDSLSISAGFDKKEMEFYLRSDFSIRIIYLLIFAVSAIKEYIKLKRS